MRTRRFLLPLAALLSPLAACTSGDITYGAYYDSLYRPGEVALAAYQGEVPVRVLGNAFAVEEGHFREAVIAAMQEKNAGPKLHFTEAEPPERIYDYRVTVAFGAAGLGYNDLCRAALAPPPAAADGVRARAAFCIGTRLISEISGRLLAANGPDDPRFQRLIGQMMLELFPPYDPNHQDRDNAFEVGSLGGRRR